VDTDELRARVLYRDDDMLILDKPAGLAVHPGRTTPDSLEAHLHHLSFERRDAPLVTHRLDRDTSGCLVLARHRTALKRINRIFAEGGARKTYWAVVRGRPPSDAGTIDRPIAKVSSERDGWRMVARAEGQRAVSEWLVLGTGPGLAWLELRPLTGRTHQLRVHCALLHTPIVGDARYGDTTTAAPMHLHARALTLDAKDGTPPVSAVAPAPPHMHAALAACGWQPDTAGR
jgi:RluA family pseudouridine synthase